MLTAADVRGRRFVATRWREGYAPTEVDALLERVAATLERPESPGGVTADEVVQARFNPTKFSSGYDQDQVDDFLDEVVATLRGAAGGTTSPSTAAHPGPAVQKAAVQKAAVPSLLRVLRVVDYALLVAALLVLGLDLAPFQVGLGALVVSIVGGTAVQLLIVRAENAPHGGPVAFRSGG